MVTSVEQWAIGVCALDGDPWCYVWVAAMRVGDGGGQTVQRTAVGFLKKTTFGEYSYSAGDFFWGGRRRSTGHHKRATFKDGSLRVIDSSRGT